MNKIIYYYQTFIGLQSILNNPIKTTHIIVSSIHFGKDKMLLSLPLTRCRY